MPHIATISFIGLFFSPKYAMLVVYPLSQICPRRMSNPVLSPRCSAKWYLTGKARGIFDPQSADHEDEARCLRAVVSHARAFAIHPRLSRHHSWQTSCSSCHVSRRQRERHLSVSENGCHYSIREPQSGAVGHPRYGSRPGGARIF